MPRVPIDGVQINVEVAGAGPPLVLLHGFATSAQIWEPHVEAFARHFRTVAVDLVGHGGSDAPEDPRRYGIAHQVEHVLGVLDWLEIRRACLLGYSMGGRVALALAIAAPERLWALVLESTSPGLRDPEARMTRAVQDAMLAETIEREGVEAFVDGWERLPLFATHVALPEGTRAALRAVRLRNRAKGLANSLRGFGQGAMVPMHDFLGEIGAPTLILAGALDPSYCEVARMMSERIPRAVLRIVEGAGHTIHLERPEIFQHAVLDFLAAVPPGHS
jgi:2-succinyl-6-hydroxy-2,4-cyclohexadiene-1-carboxylate synthase